MTGFFYISKDREANVIRLVRRQKRKRAADWASLGADARLMYVVSALVANATGFVAQDRLVEAMRTPAVVGRATELLAALNASDEVR